MSSITDTDLYEIADNPPEPPEPEMQFFISGPVEPLFNADGVPVYAPYIDGMRNTGLPFILWSYDVDGQNISLLCEDPNSTDIVIHPGHLEQRPGAEEETSNDFVTCKWFAPSEAAIANGAALPKNYPYDKSLPTINQCTNPDPCMGYACGFATHMPSCTMYEPDLVAVPVHFRFEAGEETEEGSLYAQSVRVNSGMRAIQVIEKEGDEAVIVSGAVGDNETLNAAIEYVREESATRPGVAEEVIHQTPRKSFLKGLVPV